MSLATVSRPPGPEQKRSKYRLLGLIGQGQFGRVYCAVHRQTGRLVAMKNLDRQRFPTHKFLRELRFLLSLNHANIVTCHALEHAPNGRYLIMDYCEGGTLRYLMEGEGRLHVSQSIKLITDILAGLEHAHNKGIVHCDIKPENILLTVQPTGWTAHISDFGIARLSQEMKADTYFSTTQGNTGSPAYMAPERFYGQYSRASDLYSVGILLFELLVGHRPFTGTPTELMSAHLNQPLKLPDAVPEMWRPILITSLQKLAARRFHSAGEMLTAVRAIGDREGLQPAHGFKAIHLPLLSIAPAEIVTPLRAKRVVQLERAITSLAIAPVPDQKVGDRPLPITVYAAAEGQLNLYTHPAGRDEPLEPEPGSIPRSFTLPEAIQRVMWHPQGCLMFTDRSIYYLPTPDRSGELTPPIIHSLNQNYLFAVEQNGRWLATVTTDVESRPHTLRFTALPTPHAAMALATEPIPCHSHAAAWLTRVVALNSGHVAIASIVEKSCGTASTILDIVSRRGNRLGSVTIPLYLETIHATPIPYRLVATDACDAASILLIDLKPFRVMRYAVELCPHLIEPTPWGFVLMDQHGHILLLDQYGQQAGRMDGPAHVTAMTSWNSHDLLMATWHDNTGHLLTADLRESGAELLF